MHEAKLGEKSNVLLCFEAKQNIMSKKKRKIVKRKKL